MSQAAGRRTTQVAAASSGYLQDSRPTALTQGNLAAIANNSARVRQSRALAQLVHDSPRMAAQRKASGELFDPTLQRRGAAQEQVEAGQAAQKVNRTGMPDHLKSGVEALSGMSMDHVNVHYNSPQPAQLNAHAYAQGSDIHVAPGQERHLPHEAWHVVQQAQGRVRATTQMAGAGVNDDTRLEREADLMGAKAAALASGTKNTPQAMPAKEPGGALPPIAQRRVLPYDTTGNQGTKDTYNDQVDAAQDRVNTEVLHARAAALQWGDYLQSDSARLNLWANTAQEYFDDPETVPKFLHARFGYAIEQLVSDNLPGVLNGLTVDLQVAAGHTRPDIVLRHNVAQIAWLDITAEESEGHIKGKQGAGWKTRPFVAEILYDSLNLHEVLEGTVNPLLQAVGSYNAEKNQIRHEEVEEQRVALRDALIDLQDENDWEPGYDDAADKRAQTRNKLLELGVTLGHHNLVATKGALAYAEINFTAFGFSGDDGSSIIPARNYVTEQAQTDIDTRIDDLNTERLEDIREDLNGLGAATAKTNFLQDALQAEHDDEDLSDLIPRGLALVHALRAGEEVSEMAERLTDEHNGDPRTGAVTGAIQIFLATLPDNPDYSALRDWFDDAREHQYTAELLLDLIDKGDEFEQYLYQYYGDDYENDKSDEEGRILTALRAVPNDYTPYNEADDYMRENPL